MASMYFPDIDQTTMNLDFYIRVFSGSCEQLSCGSFQKQAYPRDGRVIFETQVGHNILRPYRHITSLSPRMMKTDFDLTISPIDTRPPNDILLGYN